MHQHFRHITHWIALAALAAAVYVPFLGNPLVFDDLALYRNQSLSSIAITPLNGNLRQLPNFTIAAIDVLFEDRGLLANRIFALLAHVACVLLVFTLTRRLCAHPSTPDPRMQANATGYAVFAAAMFAVHPVAVYAAGYLVQRSIVFATGFTLLSLIALESALRTQHRGPLAGAVIAYALAVMSKEHAVMAAPAAAALLLAWRGSVRAELGVTLRYLVACTPFALYVVWKRSAEIGHGGERETASVLAMTPIPELATAAGQWLVSASVQTLLFFRYLASWLFPGVLPLSIDVRVDFVTMWTWAAPGALAFALVPILAVLALRARRTGWRMLGLGLGLAWLLFLTELSGTRLQEPFVLYRAYLWAPGFTLAIVGLLALMRERLALVAALALTIACIAGAVDRLTTLRSPLAVWDDAANALARADLPGAPRIYYNRGLERLRARQFDAARADFQRIVSVAPHDFMGPYGLAVTDLHQGALDTALVRIDAAIALRERHSEIHIFRGIILEALKRPEDAKVSYREALALGDLGGKFRLEKMERGGKLW